MEWPQPIHPLFDDHWWLVAATDDDYLYFQQEWRKRHIMPQVQWEDLLRFIATLDVTLCSMRTEKFRYGQWAFKWMIVGVPLPSRERVKKSLSHRFLSISIRFIKADSELVGCAIEIHRWRLFPVSSGTCQEDSGKPAKELLKKQFSRRMWVLWPSWQ